MSYSSEAVNSAVVRGVLPAPGPFDDASATSAASIPRPVAAFAARLSSASVLAAPLCITKVLSAGALFEETTPGAGFSRSGGSRRLVGSRAVVMFAPRPELSAIAIFVMHRKARVVAMKKRTNRLPEERRWLREDR